MKRGDREWEGEWEGEREGRKEGSRFLRRQVRWSGIPISFRIFLFVLIRSQML